MPSVAGITRSVLESQLQHAAPFAQLSAVSEAVSRRPVFYELASGRVCSLSQVFQALGWEVQTSSVVSDGWEQAILDPAALEKYMQRVLADVDFIWIDFVSTFVFDGFSPSLQQPPPATSEFTPLWKVAESCMTFMSSQGKGLCGGSFLLFEHKAGCGTAACAGIN